jgi:hypothetical protein
MTEDSLAESASPDIVLPDYLRALTPEDDGVGLNGSPSDHSSKDTLSPRQSHKIDVTGKETQNLAFSSPTLSDRPRTASVESLSKWSQADFPFASSGAHDHIIQDDPHTFEYPFPSASSGSASITSFAMTSSTVATSISLAHSNARGVRIDQNVASTNNHPGTTALDVPLSHSWMSESISSSSSCEQISRDFEMMGHQVTDPSPIRSRSGNDDISSWMLLDFPAEGNDPTDFGVSCSVCHQPSASHFVSVHNTIPQQPPRNILNDSEDDSWHLPTTTKDDGAWKWIALCFLSCLNLSKNNADLADKSLRDATVEFESLLRCQDQMLLTAAGQMIAILHMHSQGLVATKIMLSAKSATDRLCRPGDPIRVTIDYLTASADTSGPSLRDRGFTSESLRSVYQELRSDSQKGPLHRYTIAAYYNYSWLLRNEGLPEQAEEHLREVYKLSCSIFGKSHMQSITALATQAGAQRDQGKIKEAIENYKRVIIDCKPTLGKNHPYRLEGKRRLALMYGELGQKNKMLPLYWDVLSGRVRMLGRNHTFTLGQRRDYEALMRELGKWDKTAQDEVEALFESRRKAEEEATRRRRSASNSSHESECLAF